MRLLSSENPGLNFAYATETTKLCQEIVCPVVSLETD
jgi:hypothetical protein